ncbi:MAG: ABC transporter ATP-binding protein [Planctomycetota bacterium]
MKKGSHAIQQFRRLIRYALPYRGTIALIVVFMVLYGLASGLRVTLITPVMDDFMKVDAEERKTSLWGALNERFFGDARRNEDSGEGEESRDGGGGISRETFGTLVYLGIWFGLLSILIGFACFGREFFVRYLVNRSIADIRNDTYRNIIELDMRFFDNQRTGELISRVTNDIQSTQNFLRSTVSDLIQQPLTLLTFVVLAFLYSWQLSVVSFIIMPLVMFPLIKFGKAVKRQAGKSLVKLADVTDVMQQAFSGIKIVKGFRQESFEKERFRRANEGYFRKLMRVVRAKASSRGIIEFIYNAGLGVLVLLGALLVLHSVWDLTMPVLMTFILFVASMYQPLKTLTKAYNNIQEALAGSTRVFDLMDLTPGIQDDPAAVDFPDVQRGVVFRHVTFAYDTEPVLRKVSVEVPAGEVVALVGESGAGKTTMLDLLARFYDVTEGAIEIDGVDIRKIRRASLLGKMALVTQDSFLFNGTVTENILYGNPDATKAEVEEAAKAAYIHDFVLETEKGYDTVVGERGVKLSGGQKQRITIARALIRNPQILILDEATGALDTETENQVQMALQNLMKDRTTFVIAHRLSTIQHADRILVLEGGRIVEQGKHSELITRGGVYARLHEQQFQTGSGGNPMGK